MAGARGRTGRERGADLRYNMEISLDEAYRGQDRAGPHSRPRSPARPAPARAPRPAASRRPVRPAAAPGRIRHAQGFFTLERTCPGCQGRGQVIDNPCPILLGLRARDARAHAVGQHSARRRGRHPHPARPARAKPACAADRRATSTFSSRSARIRSSSARAPTCIAACRSRWWRRRSAASSKSRPSAADNTRVKVPEGTQSGRRFRLQGKGMPVLRSKQTGDMYVQVVVETPQKLTKRQRELAERIRAAVVQGHAPGSRPDSSARSRSFWAGPGSA